ncbi:hypothetical protein Q361_10947 [Flavobacterium croceum DSM 17960]|uniref:Uncharacterized protein n=1 Tax=Flavobacterium croceum DSM 17960 TaxID=1121886 RepID=A0A2S4N7D7_9FLAO|nr:hypothetical protein [Flavobacterium croceum]POS01587.1 hypothetical protein Q361_10947 [Flavobacterium croceum DSM 17960]
MEILRTNNQVSAKAQVEKAIGSIIIYSNVDFDALNNEKIRLYVERNGHNNIEITKGLVNLKRFIACATYGDDAVTHFRANVGEAFETVCVIELCEHGAIKLENNDKVKIELADLDATKVYLVDGVEEPDESKEIYTYEEKILSAETPINDVNTRSYDIAVIEDNDNITEIQYHFDNGQTCNYSRRELRALSHDNDPVAYVKKNGQVMSSFVGIIQLPLKGVNRMTVKKTGNVLVNILMRHDEDMKLFN